MPKPKQESNGPVAWKISELEKKFLALEGEVQVMKREAKSREGRISNLELRNSRLEDSLQQIGKNREGVGLKLPFIIPVMTLLLSS